MSEAARTTPEASALEIVAASVADADGIHEILRAAFGDTYLRFSVYQSRKAVVHLREDLRKGRNNSGRAYIVARGGGRILGFYSAVRRQDESFLSYIATSPQEQSRGIGRLLLEHFEAEAASSGCTSVGLDVFRGNEKACRWYERQGYVPVSARYHYRFPSAALEEFGSGVFHVSAEDLLVAQQTEALQGFASVPAMCSAVEVRLGLIDDEVLNVMEPVGRAALEVAGAVVRAAGRARKWVLVGSPDPLPEADQAESEAQAIYMTKEIPRDFDTRETRQ